LRVKPPGSNIMSMSGYSPRSCALSPALIATKQQSASLRFCKQ
jgi:hypothetical protein